MKKKQRIEELEKRIVELERRIVFLELKQGATKWPDYEPPLFPGYPVTCQPRWEWRPDTSARYSA